MFLTGGPGGLAVVTMRPMKETIVVALLNWKIPGQGRSCKCEYDRIVIVLENI